MCHDGKKTASDVVLLTWDSFILNLLEVSLSGDIREANDYELKLHSCA